METWGFAYVVMPLLIFLARIVDVTLGTVRIILISRGKRNVVPFLAFFEVLIWILAISRIFRNLNNPACYVAFAAGFATGNYVGMLVEEKLALGTQLVRVITQKDAALLIEQLHKHGFGVTSVMANGIHGPVHIIYSVTGRKSMPVLLDLIRKFNPQAFYSVEDVRYVKSGVFPETVPSLLRPRLFRRGRKGK